MSNSYSYTQSIHSPHQNHDNSLYCHDKHHDDTTPQEIVFYDPWEEFLSRQDELIVNRIDSEKMETFQQLEQLSEPIASDPVTLYEQVVQTPNSGSHAAEEQPTPEPEMPVTTIEESVPECPTTNGIVVVNSSLDPVEPSDHCNCNGVDADVVVESPSIPTVDGPIATNHFPFIVETNVTNNVNVDTMDEHVQVDSASSNCKETQLETSEEEVGSLMCFFYACL
jgi:hypothetical protein